jgi:Beta-galactosidase/beta-glucuronidase
MKSHFIIFILALTGLFLSHVQVNAYNPEISIAGFFELPGSGRMVSNFNPGWRYFKGDVKNGESLDLDDSGWEIVSTPHTVSLIPAEGSGGKNYQGPVWYRKHFILDKSLKERDVSLYFEAVMGKSTVYVNGKKIKTHLGGYLPFSVSLTDAGVQGGDTCLIAVFADNSDDGSYPPGKPQYALDFAYHGGIYRDVWLIAKSPVAITDAIEANKVAGGGVFVHYDNISEESADIFIDTEIKNSDKSKRDVYLITELCDHSGKMIKKEKSD